MEINKKGDSICSICGNKPSEDDLIFAKGECFCSNECYENYKTINDKTKYTPSKIKELLNIKRNSSHDYEPEILFVNSKERFNLVKEIINEIFKEEDKLKFIITCQVEKKGKVVNKYAEYKKKIPLIRYATRHDKKTMMTIHKLFMLDDKMDVRWWNVKSEFYKDFFMYDFICGDKQYILMSENELESEEYTVKGMVVHIDNHNQVSKDCKLNQKIPLLFINSIESNKIHFANHNECIDFVKEMDINKEKFMNYLFSFRGRSYRQPAWYEALIGSFLFSAEYDYYRNYLLVVGDPETGKTRSSLAVYEKFGEPQAYTSGSNSTIRGLIPSFNSNPIKMGALINAVRFHFVDEFLRIINAGNDDENNQRMILGKLNSLYDGMKELFESGNGRAEGKMNCKILAVSNPTYGCKNIESMVDHLDPAFLSRNIIYFQSEEHIAAIKSGNLLQEHTFKMENSNFIAIYDYMNTFRAKYDNEIIEMVYQKQGPNPKEVYESNNVFKHYKSRQIHHLHCIMDGYIKLRCLVEQDVSFEAIEQDYFDVARIWYEIVNSWLPNQNIETIKEGDIKISKIIEK